MDEVAIELDNQMRILRALHATMKDKKYNLYMIELLTKARNKIIKLTDKDCQGIPT